MSHESNHEHAVMKGGKNLYGREVGDQEFW